ncbi:hypothetical protein AB4298_03660 [Shewanella sp. 10N.261.52.F9]|uniref:hypothetical protein n=1 Tax=Shewanella TaxID=22 RepID=UPI00200DE131|nr:hypothetical protein [Shewanella marinintestina]MCL1145823.1 hypothetical protein [Shewanella marinintestina]
MEPEKVSAEESLNDADFEALLSELNRKRIRSFVFVIGLVAGLPAGFYGARWIYQLWQ